MSIVNIGSATEAPACLQTAEEMVALLQAMKAEPPVIWHQAHGIAILRFLGSRKSTRSLSKSIKSGQ